MAHLTAITPVETYAPPVDRSRRDYRHIRVLRWTLRRDHEDAAACELAVTGEDREYELRSQDWDSTGLSVERFDDALTAFQRHAMIERLLLDAGWQLDDFESELVTLHELAALKGCATQMWRRALALRATNPIAPPVR